MKCLVCIPSKGRPNNIKKYVEPFMQRLGLDYRIFVEPQDAGQYKFENVVVIDANNKGLGYATSFAKKYAEANNYDLYFRIDDDVKGIGQIENDIQRVLKAFEIPNVGAVVFPYSFEWYAKTEKLFSRKNKRTQTCYIIRTKLFRPDTRVSTFDDFYQYLLLRQDNYDTLYCSKHLIDCAVVGGGEGGLQAFNRSEMALNEINIFKSIDPTIKVISKPDKPWKFEPKFNHKKYRSKKI
jgi:hypothetical protein